MLSILAGAMIAVGGIVYLTVGGVVGALFFSIGLLTVLIFQLELFTGKAGLLATRELGFGKLAQIWCGNFIGAFIVGGMIYATPKGQALSEAAHQIVLTRTANGPIVNIILGVFCGLLMYIAVIAFKRAEGNPLYAMMPVAAFILCGYNHCVADMFYTCLGGYNIGEFGHLIPTTIGNVLGCVIFPLALQVEHHH